MIINLSISLFQKSATCTDRMDMSTVEEGGNHTVQMIKEDKVTIQCTHPNQIIFLEPSQPTVTKKDGVTTVSVSTLIFERVENHTSLKKS